MRATNYLRNMQTWTLRVHLVLDFGALCPDRPAVVASALDFEKTVSLETPLRN